MNQATCSVCGHIIPSNKNLVAEHKYNGKICCGSYTPINPVNLFKDNIPERIFGNGGYAPILNTTWDNEFIDLSAVSNR